jgi:hypothetical protein
LTSKKLSVPLIQPPHWQQHLLFLESASRRGLKGQEVPAKSFKPDMEGIPARALTQQNYVIFLIVNRVEHHAYLEQSLFERLPVATTV